MNSTPGKSGITQYVTCGNAQLPSNVSLEIPAFHKIDQSSHMGRVTHQMLLEAECS